MNTESDTYTTTTTTAALYLKEQRGITVAPSTIRRWCEAGHLPNARREGVGNRAVWRIPRADLDAVEMMKMGRPRKDETKESSE